MKKFMTSVTTVFLCAMAITSVTGLSDAGAQEQSVDYSNEIHPVTFLPWGNRKIALRDADGKWIGYSKGAMPIKMLVDGNTFRESRDAETGAISISHMLRQMSPKVGQDGRVYFKMTLKKDITLDDGTSLKAGTNEKPTEIILAADDFTVAMQPAYAETIDQTAPAKQITTQWNSDLDHNGVTADTDPTLHDETKYDTLLDKDSNGDEDDADDSDFTPAGFTVRIGNGDPFPQHFLSSPLCGCKGKMCGVSSQYGRRGKIVAGRCHNTRTKNGRHMSCNHQGMDIHSGNHESGTPVIAAADGCFKVKKENGLHAHDQGDPIDKRDLQEGGYGYTVRMTHGNGFETQYSHLASVSPAVRWGKCVKRGDRIGTMGETGNATGPHLHFGVAINHRIVNPLSYMLGSNGNGQVDGKFLSPSCSDLPDNSALDSKMKSAIAAGAGRAPFAPSSGRVSSIR